MESAVAVFAIVIGLGIAGMWSADLARGRVDLSRGASRAREEGSGSLLLPHWIAEYATAAALVAGGAGRLLGTGWALARPGRRAYAIPMTVGAVGSLGGVLTLLAA